jgi:hypothetical protein
MILRLLAVGEPARGSLVVADIEHVLPDVRAVSLAPRKEEVMAVRSPIRPVFFKAVVGQAE